MFIGMCEIKVQFCDECSCLNALPSLHAPMAGSLVDRWRPRKEPSLRGPSQGGPSESSGL